MIKEYRPTSEGQRTRKTLVRNVDKVRPLKSKTKGLTGAVGRSRGRISSRFRQRGSKKLYREIDFRREKYNIPAKVATIEYDPNRGADIALLHYADGEKRYILAPEGLKKDTVIMSGSDVELSLGNCLPLSKIPLGMEIHNIEINPGAGAVLVRGAGNYAQIIAKEGNYVNIRLPSGEVKKVMANCYATIGVLTNADLRNTQLGKAGRMRHIGFRPHVRGVAMSDPHGDHPHAGKYGKSGIGIASPRTPWGKKTKGVKTRTRKHTNYTIVKGRKKKGQ